MADAAEILKSPDYINANADTKRAIFDKHVASDPNYADANAETQRAIRVKFGIESGEGMPSGRKMSMGEAFMQVPTGIYKGFKDVTDTMFKGGASALDYLAGTNTRAAVDEAAARQNAEYQAVYGDSGLAQGGRIVGNIAATAPVGAVVAAPLRAVPALAPVAETIASSGFRTGIAPAAGRASLTGAQRGIDLGLRAGGGALTGAASAGLVNPEDIETGAVVGAAVPVVATPVAKGAAKFLGWGKDVVTGRAADVRVGEIMREALGDKLIPATEALARARPGITAVQALTEAGITSDPFMALGKMAETIDTKSAYRLLREAQEGAMQNELAILAGGATQTGAREAQMGAKNALTEITTPMREGAIQRANVGGTVTKGIAPEIESFSRAPNFTPQGVPQALGQSQAQLDALAVAGLKPIDTDAIVGSITAKLNDPKIGPSDVNQAVLGKVANKIKEWTARGGGVIDADALYSIRKNAVNEEIARLYPSADANQQARYAAKLLGEIKPLIDDAIETAGGKGWKNYLQTFESGMKKIDQQKLAALALEKFKGSKEDFLKLVRGDDPDAVEKIFGPGSFNIVKEMDPLELYKMSRVASKVERDIGVEKEAAAGARGLARIIGMSENQINGIPAFFSTTTTTINMALKLLRGKINQDTYNVIEKSMLNGRSAADIIQTLPSKERGPVLRTLMNSRQWNPEAITAPTQISIDRQNNLAPENRNALRP